MKRRGRNSKISRKHVAENFGPEILCILGARDSNIWTLPLMILKEKLKSMFRPVTVGTNTHRGRERNPKPPDEGETIHTLSQRKS